jgi:RNA polymerase sigma-70 factor (ECF subfamily)
VDASLPSLSPDLLLQHGRFVRALARELLADEHAVEDVVQETWLRYLTRPPREGRATRSWLRAVASRLSIEGLRTRSRRTSREERAARPEAQPSIEEELAHGEILRGVVEAVLALDEPYRTTVLLAYWRGWDARRIAAETGEPLATVRSRLQRAHAKLRERLDRTHGREAWGLALGAVLRGGLEGGGGGSLAAGGVLAALLVAASFLYTWSRSDSNVSEADAGQVATAGPEGSGALPERAPELPGSERTELAPSPAAIRITGTVVDGPWAELGLVEKPAARVPLRARLTQARHGGPKSLAELEVHTDDAGGFVLDFEDPGSRPLWVQAAVERDEHYRSLRRVEEVEPGTREWELRRVPCGILHGQVVDDSGGALGGVALRFVDRLGGAVREARSETDGSFAVPDLGWPEEIGAELAGHVLLPWDAPRQLEEGGWEDMVLRLARGATLEVVTLGPRSEPIADAQVTVRLDPSEPAALGLSEDAEGGWAEQTTDAAGRARFEGLWADRKLQVSVRPSARVTYSTSSQAEGALRFDDEARDGQPLVLEAGAVCSLEARFASLRVAGTVGYSDGVPAGGAKVALFDLDRSSSSSVIALETDDAGRFSGGAYGLLPRGSCRVDASDAAGKPAPTGELGYGGPAEPIASNRRGDQATSVSLDARDPARLLDLELVLDATHSIEGRIRSASGEPVRGGWNGGSRVWAVPAGEYRPYRDRPLATARGEVRDGRFELRGLRGGLYDVLVSEELQSFYTFENFVHRFPLIAAGTRGLELELPAREPVRVRLRLSGGEPRSFIRLIGKFFPADPGSFAAEPAPTALAVRGAQGWPTSARYDFAGIGGGVDDRGSWSLAFDGIEGDGIEGELEHELPPLGAGWYALGVHAEGFFAQATPLLHFAPGEYALDFELLPIATLRGRIANADAREFLAVQLVDAAGRPIPVTACGSSKPAPWIETSASGAFDLREAPAGSVRLRVGRPAELARGSFRTELALELLPGDNPPVELRF